MKIGQLRSTNASCHEGRTPADKRVVGHAKDVRRSCCELENYLILFYYFSALAIY